MKPKLLFCFTLVLSGGLFGFAPFGDNAPLHALLTKLSDKVPQLSLAKLSDPGPYGQNSVEADYTVTNGGKLSIIAKSYDSAAAAKAGQEFDRGQIQAGGWNKTEIIEGVQVFEFTDYGTMYFQTGLDTFSLAIRTDEKGTVRTLLPKVASALIAGLASAPAGQIDPRLSTTGMERDADVKQHGADARQYFRSYLLNCDTNGMNCLWFLQNNSKIGMEMTIHLDQETVFTVRDVYDWARQGADGNRRLTDSQVLTLKEIITNLPASNTNAGFDKSVFVSVRNGGKMEVFQYDRQHVPPMIQRIYDIGGGYLETNSVVP